MDFYYAMTNYHVLCCLLHKMTINKNKSILFISSYLTNNQPTIIEKIKKSNIFEKIYIYDEITFTRSNKKANKNELDNEIKRICSKVDKKIGKKIKNVKNIYLCSDFYSIGVYLISNKIKYNYFEDGCGTLSRPIMPYRIIEKDNIIRAQIVKKLKSFGENIYTINRYGNLDNQEEGYYNKKDINFNVEKILESLDEKEIIQLLDIYDMKKIKIEGTKVILFLTMHYNEIMNESHQKEIYGLLLDYFTKKDEEIIIKPHPADSIMKYKTIFKNIKEVNRYMPSELLPYCIDKKFAKGITCWSTAIYSLKNIIKKIITFDIRIDDTYKDFDKYYSIVMFLNHLKNKEKLNLKLIDINEIQFMRLLEEHFSNYNDYFVINNENSKYENIYIQKEFPTGSILNKYICLECGTSADEIIHIRKIFQEEIKNEFIGLYNFNNNHFEIKFEHRYSNYLMNISVLTKQQYIKVLQNIVEKDNIILVNKLKNKIESHEKDLITIKEESRKSIEFYEKLLIKKDQYINDIDKTIEAKNEEIARLKNSTSWKITKPLRKLIDIIRKIKK